ncbi:unnamed protein product [Cylindrotheca closterium]|uniref:Uncharacterized protein n=1 Tax=Cylindrotheca closterium TaxID=2856 RepID=A0AAD2CQT1_9STRA|nr:unnamed protein product [Cylindrotheca closterium]
MPPKKKAKTTKKKSPPMWLVIFDNNNGGYDEHTIEHALYDSLQKATAGGLNLMDANSPWGSEWRHGVEGLGHEEEENCHSFEYIPQLGASGGDLISNANSDVDSHHVVVSIRPLEVNPSKLPIPSSSPVEGQVFF